MLRIIGLSFLLAFSLSGHAKTNIAQELEDIYAKHESSSSLNVVERSKLLNNLDSRMRDLVNSFHNKLDNKAWQEKYGTLGLKLNGPDNGSLSYTGKLFEESKRLRQDYAAEGLEVIYTQYMDASKLAPTAKTKLLVDLDQRLRAVVYKSFGNDSIYIDPTVWEKRFKKYQELGLELGGYDASVFVYREKLLQEAKLTDIDSTYDAYTSYLDIEDCINCYPYGGRTPKFDAALTYEKKYPKGPFIEDIYNILATFYDGLYGVVTRQIEAEMGMPEKNLDHIDNKDGSDSNPDEEERLCFLRYITSEPLTVQKERARELAIKYYSTLLTLHPEDKDKQESISNLKAGYKPEGYVCASTD